MRYENHVILGAGGAITHSLVPELIRNKERITLVSRSGRALSGTTPVAADATVYEDLLDVVPDGSVVYLLVGLPYDITVWRDMWPRVMDTAIRVCEERQCLLVFLDNVYMYGSVDGPMTEETPHRPTSKKGRVRAQIAEALIEAYESGRIRGIIARSADFYGPGAEKNGVPNVLIIDRMVQGKRPQWLADAKTVHSLTYTTDCGRALPLLAADERAHNQIWHLPTAHPPITMEQFAALCAEQLDVRPKVSVLGSLALRLGGLFDSTIRELPEMLYQNRSDYVFDSTKFERHFSFEPTSYEQGITETVAYHRGLVRR